MATIKRDDHIVNGLLVPYFVLQEEVDKLKHFQLYPDDVCVVTYPKCGTTWMQHIVRLIKNNGVGDDVKINEAVPWLEALTTTAPGVNLDKITRPRLVKTHMSYDLCPCGPPNTTPCKYIYVTRNPKDAAVSMYFMRKRIVRSTEDWDVFWKNYVEGKLWFGDFFDHVLSWWPHRDDENVLFLKYEDMKKNLPAAVSQVASFMGANLSSEVIAKIADKSSFDAMKGDDTANYSWSKLSIPGTDIPFMRKGTVGNWRNHLSPEQSAQMDAICTQRLEGTGLEFQYE